MKPEILITSGHNRAYKNLLANFHLTDKDLIKLFGYKNPKYFYSSPQKNKLRSIIFALLKRIEETCVIG